MIRSIHHVNICIPTGQEDSARTFYCGILGMTEIEKPEALRGRGGLWLKAGESDLHISTEETPNASRQETGAHIAYQVDDILKWRAKMNSEEIQLEDCPAIPGWHRMQFRDPFGNRIELLQVM